MWAILSLKGKSWLSSALIRKKAKNLIGSLLINGRNLIKKGDYCSNFMKGGVYKNEFWKSWFKPSHTY